MSHDFPKSPMPGYEYRTPKASDVFAWPLLAAYTPIHTAVSLMNNVGPNNGPKLKKPEVDINKEEWENSEQRYDAFFIGIMC